jgi:transposase
VPPDNRLHHLGITPIPGIKNLSAQVIVSEIGIDMSRFPSAAHLTSWACICPRNDESAGKRRSNRQRKGATWLKTTLRSAPGLR